MKTRHLSVLVTATALAALPAVGAQAMPDEPQRQQQAEGRGSATALEVEGVVTVSDCDASTGQAECTSLGVLGSEVSGTNQEGEGSSESALGCTTDLGIPEDQLEACAFRSDSNVEGDGSSNSSSEGLYVNVGDGTVEASVLRAQASSNGDAESDGVVISLGGEEVHVLHAESSGGEGSAAVAVIGGEGVLTTEDTGGVLCPADVDPVVVADVVCASGSFAGISEFSGLDGAAQGGVITVNAGDDQAGAEAPSPEDPAAPAPDPDDGDDALPFTGMNAMGLLAAGSVALGAGWAVRRRTAGEDA